jgi:hypothetical protein
MPVRAARAPLALLIATALLVAAFAASAAAQVSLPDTCATDPADVTLQLSDDPNQIVAATGLSGFDGSICLRYLVDVKPGLAQYVTLHARYGDQFTGSYLGLLPLPLSQEDCLNYRQSVTVYRKSPWPIGSGFTAIASSTLEGAWRVPFDTGPPAHCELRLRSGDSLDLLEQHTTPTFLPVTFRVAASARVGTAWKRVSVTASH